MKFNFSDSKLRCSWLSYAVIWNYVLFQQGYSSLYKPFTRDLTKAWLSRPVRASGWWKPGVSNPCSKWPGKLRGTMLHCIQAYNSSTISRNVELGANSMWFLHMAANHWNTLEFAHVFVGAVRRLNRFQGFGLATPASVTQSNVAPHSKTANRHPRHTVTGCDTQVCEIGNAVNPIINHPNFNFACLHVYDITHIAVNLLQQRQITGHFGNLNCRYL